MKITEKHHPESEVKENICPRMCLLRKLMNDISNVKSKGNEHE